MDRISNLPDDVVFHIMSFLSAKDAARTRIVSKNFKNLITIIPDFVFDGGLAYNLRRGRFKLCADRLLARHASHRIRRVSLKLPNEDFSQYYNLVIDFMCNVLNRGVVDLEVLGICFFDQLKRYYELPLEVLTCKTVVKMTLGGFVIHVLPENASLPALKNLVLDSVQFDSTIGGCAFARLLSVSPVLEELVIDDFHSEQWKWSRIVSSVILKKLTIRCTDFDRGDWYDLETISFDTPNLTYLCYTDYVAFGYPVVNLNSLVEAHLALLRRLDNIDPINLIKGLKNVHFLTLEFRHTERLFVDFSEAVPMFENMSHLSIGTGKYSCWHALKFLVKKSPNLKTLTIEELHYEDEDVEDVCKCLLGYSILASIEVLKITSFYGDIGGMAQVKHILQKLPCLELLKVHVSTFGLGDEKKQQIMGDLLNLPRASSKCKVEVRFT